MPKRELRDQTPAVAVTEPRQEGEGAPPPASDRAGAGPAGQNTWQATKARYALAKYQPYADALAQLQPIGEKLSESTESLSRLREEVEQLRTAAKQAQAGAVDVRAGLLLGKGTETQVAEAQKKVQAAQAQLEEALAQLQEAEQVHAIVQRAHVKAQDEVRHQAQAAREYWQPRIREDHEAAVRRAALAFRELSAALTEEQAIRDAIEYGLVLDLARAGLENVGAGARGFIHTESMVANTLDWFLKLDRFQFGEWISGFRKQGYPVD